MSKENAVATIDPGAIMEAVIAKGDLSKLTPDERAKYYARTCESLGINPFTQPFEYITLQGKLTLYAKRGAADQLRKVHGVTLVSLDRRFDPETEMYEVSARMRDRDGREDEDISAVHIGKLQGDARGNAMKKAVTQAKRRCTLSLCGLGFLDETEIDQIPDARRVPVSSYVPDDEPTIDITEAEYQVDVSTIDQAITERQRKFLFAVAHERGFVDHKLEKYVNEQFGVRIPELTRKQASELIDEITAMPEVDGDGVIVEDDNDLGQSIIAEHLASIYDATSRKRLGEIADKLRADGISHDDLKDAWESRWIELGGTIGKKGEALQPELVGAAAGEAGLDRHSS